METKRIPIKQDLCPRKPDRKILDIGNTIVTIEVTVTSEKPIVSTKLDRCVKAGQSELNRYQKIIQDDVLKLADKIKATKDKMKMQQMAADTTTSVQGACRAVQSAVQVAVKKQLTVEAQGDRNLTESRVVAVVSGAFGVIKVAKDATSLAVTAGADVSAWLSLVKDCAGLAGLVHDACKGEQVLKKDLLNAIGAMTTDKQRQVIEHQRAAKSTSAKVESLFKDLYRKYKPKADAAEAARKKYRNHVTKVRQNVDSLYGKVESLENKLKQAKDLKEGVTIGSKMMIMKREGKELKTKFEKAEQFSNDMAFLLTEAGVKVDDRTIAQKLQALDGLGDLSKSASEIKSAVEDVKKIIENIGQLV